jgi:hypothetical protein
MNIQMQTIYTERLNLFANHLAGIQNPPDALVIKKATFVVLRHNTRASYEVFYLDWIIKEFCKWACLTESDDPELGIEITDGVLASLFNYFDLTEHDFSIFEFNFARNHSDNIVIAEKIRDHVKKRLDKTQNNFLLNRFTRCSCFIKLNMQNGKVLMELPLN